MLIDNVVRGLSGSGVDSVVSYDLTTPRSQGKKKQQYRTIRKKFPKIYRYEKCGGEYYVVDCRSKQWGLKHRKGFNNEVEAVKYAQEIDEQIQKNGRAVANNLVYQDRDLEKLVAMLQPFGVTLDEAIAEFVIIKEDEIRKTAIPSIQELALKWYEDKRDSKSNPLRPKTKNELKVYWSFITQKLGQLKPHDVTHAIADELIDSVYSSDTNQTLKHYLKYVRMFFKWCVEQDYIPKNPTDKIRVKLNPDEVKIYPPDEIERLLRLCEKQFPSLLGYYCLTVFAGLRPSEAQRVEWKDVDFATKQIFVSKLGKRGARRISLKAPDTIWIWLEHIKNKNPNQSLNPVKNHANLQRKSREAFGEWIQDGLRHSFGTYYYNYSHNIYEVVYAMGNSEKIAKRHYLREVTTEWMEKYWALRPAA